MTELPECFQLLLAGPPTDANVETRVNWAGRLIDYGDHYKFHKEYEKTKQALDKAFEMLSTVPWKEAPPEIQANYLDYYLGNLWADRVHLERVERKTSYLWGSDNFAKCIFYYRHALIPENIAVLDKRRQAEILTNLGNMLDSSGRFIEAIEAWKSALKLDLKNGMTWGNIGQGFYQYGRILQDHGHQTCIWLKGKEYLEESLKADKHEMYPEARKHFESIFAQLNSALKGMKNLENLDSFSLGDSAEEIEYRNWILQNNLFLNPLNDAYPNAIAARDILSLPNVIVPINNQEIEPWRHGLFDQLKQEFVSARYLYFEGIHPERPHFSDRDVPMINSLDYPSYGLATEKLKAAFRMLFSILDKTAYFLNYYFQLAIPENEVSFSGLWYQRKVKNTPRVFRPKILEQQNWPLMGLYWLHRDLGLGKTEQVVLEPSMKDIRQIRIHLEHKFLRLKLEMGTTQIQKATPISTSISRESFEDKGLRLLKLIRAALIYTHGAIFVEERKRRAESLKKGKIVPEMPVTPWEDEWKL